MMKLHITLLLITTALYFGGCGSDDDKVATSTIVEADEIFKNEELNVTLWHKEKLSTTGVKEVAFYNVNDSLPNATAFSVVSECAIDANTVVKVYIDTNGLEDGVNVEGISADHRFGSDGFYSWNGSSWLPSIDVIDMSQTIKNNSTIVVLQSNTKQLFTSSSKVVVAAECGETYYSTIIEVPSSI